MAPRAPVLKKGLFVTTRNRKAFAAGQVMRDAIRAIMAAHPPLARPLSAKAINARLPARLRRSERDIRHHVLLIRAAAENVAAAAMAAPAEPRHDQHDCAPTFSAMAAEET